MATTPEHRVAIVSASVGAGHDGVAAELTRRLTDAGWAVDRYDFLDLLPAAVGRAIVRGYTHGLRSAPWTWQATVAAFDRAWPARVAGWASRAADTALSDALAPGTAAVVSTYPLASQSLGRLRRTGRLAAPAITYLTDPAVHRTWLAPGVDVHLTPYLAAGIQAMRHGAVGVHVVAPAVAPGFRPPRDRREVTDARTAYRLPPVGRLALIVTGSLGLGHPERTARDVLDTGLATPVVVCGRHVTLYQRLTGIPGVRALGWVDDMPTLMRAVDVVIDNAGGMTLLEALATGAPVLTYRPLAGHGSANAGCLDAAGLVRWVRRPFDLGHALADALSGRHAPRLGSDADPLDWITRTAAGPGASVSSSAG